MNSIKKRARIMSACVVVCYVIFSQEIGSAQDTAMEALKHQLEQMQQQMQRMMERIEQLEGEKATDTAAVGKAGQNPKFPSQQRSQPHNTMAPGAIQPAQQLSSSVGSISRAFNPAISVNGLFLGGYASLVRSNNRLTGLNFENGFNLQEAEFRFVSDVDPFFRADMTLAIDREREIELEEGYVTSSQLPGEILPRGLSLKAGKFFTAFGKHNLLHTHQFPFIDRPLVSQAAFGDEGLNEPGVELSYLLPTSWFSEITFQGLSGQNSSLFRFADKGKPRGAYLGHWKNFFDLSDETTLEFGQSYIGGRNASPGRNLSHAVGADLTLKWRPLDRALDRALIWQNEYIFFSMDRGRKNVQNNGGLYSSLQYRLSRLWWLQGRYDLLGVPHPTEGLKHRWTALLALVPSEFSALRLQYSRTNREKGAVIDQLLFQLNFTIGSHPAHRY